MRKYDFIGICLLVIILMSFVQVSLTAYLLLYII